jgi:hypothetical protein
MYLPIKPMRVLLTIVLTSSLATLTLSACQTYNANVDLGPIDGVAIKPGDINGERLGSIIGERGGAVWNRCDQRAQGSLRELVRAAKLRGANAVGNLKWAASGTSEAACKKEWGYVLLFPFLFTPFFMSTQVTGVAYKTKGSGLLNLPQTPDEETAWIAAVLAHQQL